MKLFFLSKENIPLAEAEVAALIGTGKVDENVLLVNTKKTTDRLAYTRLIGSLLFEVIHKDIEKKIKSFNWNKLIKESFAVTVFEKKEASHSLGRKFGGMIYDLLKHPRVDLDSPGTKIVIVKTKKKFYLFVPEWENSEKFSSRKPHLRPETKPFSMNPKLARVCVNLTGATKSVYDPFCGLGGFLIEAGLMGLQAIGSDLDREYVRLCAKNLQHYNITRYSLFHQDATVIKKKYDYIVTDLPYGKNTKNIGKDLYAKFIKNLEKILKKRAVVIFPSFFNAKKLLMKSKLKIKGHYTNYVHGSLSREIYVLE